ncbi:hypothetical protein TGME49_226290 [Toxoplasma gondii ME49]|uniref:Uncharacterized protein n=2 Tax=Toxoplasma gondii TaxID=5811 RepID=A0A086KLW1_TOXGO|nr:hypothetical protein TGME49_226290 [Toxoplasma gondii ME49]EPT27124.1 hypothetical protein TGME49_226290 [Toxoplasma gondii ME49]KFG45379.1 hypothetical protein TGDOM2_226290 [Toxoplasma gondii GAB2-2007-GAL-DOM2]|eukprot:XP_002366282.1 hypothetical protein TGME49_226290 [Toxoplasma gondii ME49]
MSFSGRTENGSGFRRQPADGPTLVKNPSGHERVYYREKLLVTPCSQPGVPLALYLSSVNRPAHSSSKQASLPPEQSCTRSNFCNWPSGDTQERQNSPSGLSSVERNPSFGSATPEEQRCRGNMARSNRETVCQRWTTRFKVSAPKVSEYGAFSDNELINLQLTQRDLEELMALIRREQETRLQQRVQQNRNLEAVVAEQRQQIRILSLELKRTQDAVEEKTFLLDTEKRKSEALERQLRMLRKLRQSEKQEQHANLKDSESRLEKDLEKYVEAAHIQGLSFFDRTTEDGTREADHSPGSFPSFTEGGNSPTSGVAGDEQMVHVEGPTVVEEAW